MKYFDFIVAGSGLAGLYSAYRASKYGTVALITKKSMRESSSYFAQGGIAAVTGNDDSPYFHFVDTVVAGRGLCDNSVVNILVNEGPERIKELINEGMEFDTKTGNLLLGLEGGHLRRRILHSGGDATGMKITEFMISKIADKNNISLFENSTVTEIIVKDNSCVGLKVWDKLKEEESCFYGGNTIIALGGASAIYDRTSNPETSVGDGVALAYKAGCAIADMEFIQFHPTTLYTGTGETFLISEAVRGEGAWLVNSKGERFMQKIHELAELAPRDIVARSIYKEIQKQDEPFVYLVLNHLDPDVIKNRFPNIYKKCSERGFDFTDKIPVAPAAHYMVGGIRTDEDGKTNISNLYAAGEVASNGLMGANRLASNSLIECIVFGYRAVEHTRREAASPASMFNISQLLEPTMYLNSDSKSSLIELKREVEKIMSAHAGIIRNKKSLKEGLASILQLENRWKDGENEYFMTAAHNLLIVARLVMTSALFREESRGGHFREDFPQSSDEWLFHIIQQKEKEIYTIPVDNKM